jgi:hypothetical protein
MSKIIGVLVSVVLAVAPSIGLADEQPKPTISISEKVPGLHTDKPRTVEGNYAVREAAAPELGAFEGGTHTGIYIGGSALTVALLVVLIVVLI